MEQKLTQFILWALLILPFAKGACTAGYECDVEADTSTTQCATGYSTASSTPYYYCIPAPIGYTSDPTHTGFVTCYSVDNSKRYSDYANGIGCTTCPAGLSCSNASPSVIKECDAGEYSDGTDNTCHTCPLDNICPSRKATISCTGQGPGSTLIVCPAASTYDTFCIAGQYLSGASCATCVAGQFCPGDNTAHSCPSGTYSSSGSATICTICEAGNDCNTKTSNPSCSSGFFSLVGFATCLQSPVGFSLSSASSLPSLCSMGKFSTDGLTCQTCTAGNYCPSVKVAAKSCATDYAGYYTSTTNNFGCLPCPGGKFCGSSTGPGTSCSSGYHLDPLTYAGSCSQCAEGNFCTGLDTSEVACPSGTYSSAGATTCQICPANYYCPDTKSSNKQSCAPGKFSQKGQTSCFDCPPGYTCSGTTAPSRCSSGQYASTDSLSCNNCEAGYACPDTFNAARHACGSGTYSAASQTKCNFANNNQVSSGSNTAASMQTCTSGQYISGTSCVDCPAGSYCSDPITGPISCPTGYTSTLNSLTCTICPQGSQCPNLDGTSIATCSLGYYAYYGSTACIPCPLGHYCPNKNLPIEIRCEEGYYASTTGNSACTICPANNECIDKKSANSCGTNEYSLAGWGICRPCPAGYDCNFSPPQACGVGYYSPEGVRSCIQCKAGSYCVAKSSQPALCLPGTYSATDGLSSCATCATGKYSYAGATSCTLCPAGYMCPQPYLPPFICPAGYFSPGGTVSSCTICTNGYVCPKGSTTATDTLCPLGFYCQLKSVSGTNIMAVLPCPAGKYGATEGLSDSTGCSACPAGYYCPYAGMSKPMTCPQGAYCSGNDHYTMCTSGTYNPNKGGSAAGSCINCPVGNYCPQGSPQPIPCTPGYYCAGTTDTPSGMCPDGKYSMVLPISQSSDCLTCPKGYYCTSGNFQPTACPPGTYNSNTGQISSAACVKCAAGTSCPKYGNIADSGVPCPPGYFCAAGTEYPTQTPCSAGSYNDEYSKISQADCVNCPQGYYCTAGTNRYTNPMVPCPPGYFCPSNTGSATTNPCNGGTYTPYTKSISQTDCMFNCPPGYYCPAGSSAPQGLCKNGYFCPEGTSAEDQYPCPLGYYSPSAGLRSQAECVKCERGYYCPLASTAATKQICLQGTYNHFEGKGNPTDCLDCDAGYYCPNPGMTAEIPCDYGYYSGTKATACTICPATYYCNKKATTAALISGITLYCDPGYICNAGVSEYPKESLRCKKGYYCLARAQDPTPCPPGKYLPNTGGTALSDCQDTPAGFYSTRGSATPTGPCAPGYYCTINSVRPNQTPCQAGTFRTLSGAASQSDCGACPAGYYCPIGTVIPFPCTRGSYCLAGVSEPAKCLKGYFGASPLLRQNSQCTLCWAGRFCSVSGLSNPDGKCDPGYYCKGGAFLSNPNDGTTGSICTAGGVCPQGSIYPQPCLPGTYGATAGLTSTSQCTNCPATKYCLGEVNNVPTGLCQAGYYCPLGSKTATEQAATPGHYTGSGQSSETQCPAGSYSPDYATATSCTTCPAGYMCALGDAQTFTDCPAGQYCVAGSSSGVNCLGGTYSSITHLHASGECTLCPPGFYCSGGGSTTTGSCQINYYCPAGSSIATTSGCPTGSYCPPQSGRELPCPTGTYNDVPSIGDVSLCKNCPATKYCSIKGISTPDGTCDAGYYCPGSNTVPRPKNYVCIEGEYCPSGSSNKTPCPAGKYQNSKKQGSCIPCPRGFFCLLGATTFIGNNCPVGYFCTEGTSSATQNPCPQGTYSNILNAFDSSQCISCDPGYYCPSTGQNAPFAKCNAGYYCIRGAIVPNPNDSTGKQCPIGYYCPQGTSYPIPCPPGSACTSAGLSATSGLCNNGYYCTLNAITKTPSIPTDGGGPCLEGYYCPSGVSAPIPCPAGTYSNAKFQYLLSSCTKCDNGYYCGTLAAKVTTGQCSAGYYCTTAVAATIGFTTPTPATQLCPPGYYCPLGTPDKVACPSDKYMDMYGASVCVSCPAGYECTASSKALCTPNTEKTSFYCPGNPRTRQSCGEGKVNYAIGSSSSSDCKPCPAGKYCPETPTAAEDKVNTCPNGYYCPAGTGSSSSATPPQSCGLGNYCPAGSSSPILCPPGKYCDGTNMYVLTGKDCTAGYFCKGGANTATPSDGTTGYSCPKGAYCESGTIQPIMCPPGTYRDVVGGVDINSCFQCTQAKYCQSRGLINPTADCPAGYYCPTGTAQSSKLPCDPGNYCPTGSYQQTVCPDNSFQSLPVKATCDNCPERFYCKNTNAADAQAPKICPTGKYCVANTQPQDCPLGTYNPRQGMANSGECEPCPPGFVCDSTGLSAATKPCTQGYYCTSGVQSTTPIDGITGNICPKGHYCPAGTASPIACAPGTLNDNTGSYDSSACVNCPQRYYCPHRGGSSLYYSIGTSAYYCYPGYLCISGSAVPNPTDGVKGRACTKGKYCVAGALSETSCAAGTYNPYDAQGACYDCPAGRLCNTIDMQIFVDCPIGKYCQVKTSVPSDCPAGTYNPIVNLAQSGDCFPCDPGKYCLGGQSSPDGDCDPGYVCPRGSSQKTSTNVYTFAAVVDGLCPKGYYCLSGSKAPTPCPIGQYQDQTGQTSCKDCPVGRYCDIIGISDPSIYLCGAGHYCVLKAITKTPRDVATEGGDLCSAGHYCPEGTLTEVQCPAGTFEPRKGSGSSTCQDCPAGFYCSLGSDTPTPCPAQYYCPVKSGTPTICPPGTYSDATKLQAVQQCRPCPSGQYCSLGLKKGACDPGFYCEYGAALPNDPAYACPIGHYCLAGCQNPTVCPQGKVRATTGGKTQSDCTDCTAGSYCISGIPTPFDCPKGHYCPAGSNEPIPCPSGYYLNAVKKIALTDCVACTPGYNCSSTGIADVSVYLCEAGNYCDVPSAGAKPCPAGKYSNTPGLAAVTSCLTCPEGYYCLAGTVTPTICDEGKYCPSGSKVQQDCTAGYYCPYTNIGGKVIPKRTPCPGGYYCPINTIYPYKCLNGYYCPVYSAEPTLCPSGTMGNNYEYNDAVETGCMRCPPGTYSIKAAGVIAKCKICPAGYVCKNGTTSNKPLDPIKDGGYPCPKGAYCPEGSYIEQLCPTGYFNNLLLSESFNACMPCEANSYSEIEGQSGCKPCGPSSNSEMAARICACKGKNRVFQFSDGKCVCKQFYISVLSDDTEDSSNDCRPLLMERCPSGQLRDTFGSCVDQQSCTDECKGKSGKRTPGIGICECDSVQDPDMVCDATCRNNTLKITVDTNGKMWFNGTALNTTAVKVAGEPKCISGNCKLVSIKMQTGFSADYSASSTLTNPTKTRLLADSSSTPNGSISNPAICIKKGDSVSFDINGDSYPVYLKDAMANTNQDFDYSQFIDLANRIKNGEYIQVFIYTFSQAGIYVFGDNAAQKQQMVFAVLETSQQCPSEDKYIMPITTQNLLKMGVNQNETIKLSPNWGLIGCAFAVILILIPAVIVFISVLHSRSLRELKITSIGYTKEQASKPAQASQAAMSASGRKPPITEESQLLAKSSRMIIDIAKKQEEDGEVDPQIFVEIYNQLQSHVHFVKSEFDKKAGQDRKHIGEVWTNVKDLKKAMKKKLKDLAKIFGKNIKYMFSKKKEQKKESKEDSEMDKIEAKSEGGDSAVEMNKIENDRIQINDGMDNKELEEAKELDRLKEESQAQNKEFMDKYVDVQVKKLEEFKEKVLDNSKLTDGDKVQLMKEYEKDLQTLQKQILLDQTDQQSQLKLRLEGRKQKRVELLEQKEKLQGAKQILKRDKDNKIFFIQKQLIEEEEKVANQCDAEFRVEEQKLEDRKNEDLKKMREKCDRMLKANSDPQDRAKCLEEFEKGSIQIQRIYEDEKNTQLASLKKQLEMRKEAEKKRLKEEAESKVKELKNERDAELKRITEQENVIFNALANAAIEEKVAEAKETAADKDQAEEAKVAAIKEEFNNKMLRLNAQEQDKIAQIKEEQKKEEEKIIEDFEAQKIMTKAAVRNSCEDLNEKKEKLKKKLTESLTEDRKAILMEELQKVEGEINSKVDEEIQKQKESFQEKIKQRRMIKAEKEAKAREAMANAKADIEKQQDVAIKEVKVETREEKLKRIIEELKKQTTPEELPIAVEKLIEDKHMEELSELLSEQYKEKAKILSQKMTKLIDDKLTAMHDVKNKFKIEYDKLKAQCDEGEISKDDYERRIKDIQSRENDELKEIELAFIQKSNDAEQELCKEITGKYQEQLVALREKQFMEKKGIMDDLSLTNNYARILLEHQAEYLSKELDDYKSKLNAEKEAKIKELERRKERLNVLALENEDKIRSFNDETKKMLDQLAKKEKAKISKKKQELEQSRKEKSESLARAEYSEEEKKKLIAEHNKELESLIQAMENEQKRQSQKMMEKLEKKLLEKDKLKSQKQVQLAMYKQEIENAMDDKLKQTQIKYESKVAAVDTKAKLLSLIEKFDGKKMLFYKKKNLIGVENIEEFNQMNVELIAKFEAEEKEDDEFEGTLVNIDFDDLAEKLANLEKCVTGFTNNDFERLMQGFRDINNQLSLLKKKAIAKGKR